MARSKLRNDQSPLLPIVDAGGAFEIRVANGSPAVRITTDENLLPYVENNVSDDTLHLRTREHVWPTHGIKVVISSPTRAGGRIRGAVKLTVKQLSGPTFALESKARRRVSLDGNIDRLLVDMTWREPVSTPMDCKLKLPKSPPPALATRRLQSPIQLKASDHWRRQSDLLRQPAHDQETDHWRRLNSPQGLGRVL